MDSIQAELDDVSQRLSEMTEASAAQTAEKKAAQRLAAKTKQTVEGGRGRLRNIYCLF